MRILSRTICPVEGTEAISPARTAITGSGKRMRCRSAGRPLNAQKPVPAKYEKTEK